MLGRQGAASTKRESDPEKVSCYQPDDTPMINWLVVLASAAMGVAAAGLLFSPDVGIVARWVLAVGAVFFLYGAVIQARRANRRRVAGLDAQGLWVDGPRKRKLIRWDNIEQLSVFSMSGQDFNIVALKKPHDLLAQYDEQEARAAVLQENIVGALAGAIGIFLGGRPTTPDLASRLEQRRKQYGGEVWITRYDRDRSAAEFEALLQAWRKKYSTGVGP